MKLRTKTLLVICIVFSILCLVIIHTMEVIIMPNYSVLENDSVSDQVVRVFHQFNQELRSLETLSWDWSIWDDTYSFVEEQNETYIQNNLLYDIFEDIDINVMLFFNNSGSLVYGKAFDFQQKSEIVLPASFYSMISTHKELLHSNQTEETSYAGIVLYYTNETPLFMSCTPILHSNRDGPIIGSLIVGRFLDETRLTSIENVTQLEITLHKESGNIALDSEHKTSEVEGKPIYVQPLNSTKIAGYIGFDDIFGNPVFILQVTSARDIYNQGIILIQNLIIAIIITIVVLVIITIIILDRYVTSRLTHLAKSVENIKNYEDLMRLLQVKGNDEIATVEQNINNMLTSLQKTWAMKNIAEISLQKKIDELERFKTMTIDRELKMIELKKQLDELKARSGGMT